MTSQILLDSASAVLGRSVGLRLDPAQRHRLDYWLKTTALARGIADAAIVQEIAAEGPALQAVLDELTVQETSFFRDRGQFDALRNAVLPTLEPPLTIWSAGCAWGQEPYSLAMLLDDSGYPEWRVVASDISSRALKQAQSARFSEHQLTGLSETDRGRYLNRVGDDHWEVIPRLRERVTVFRHNLVRNPVPPLARGSAVVFCRNVLIYFDRADVLEALDKIADTMDPTGWAFLGYSESLWQVTDRFRLVRVGKAFAYRQSMVAVADPPPAASKQPAPSPAASTKGSPSRVHTVTRTSPTRTSPPPAPAVSRADSQVPAIASLLAEGEAALQARDAGTAVRALRKAAYLDPDHGVAQFQLGLAFEMLGDRSQAKRAFSAARAALGRSSAAAEAALEGYQITELIRLLDQRLHRAQP